MKTSLQPFTKLEVKATLQTADGIWLGTAKGLYRFDRGTARALRSWRHEEVRAIGPAPDGFYTVAGSPPRQTIHRCDASGTPVEEVTPPAAENITAISGTKNLWLGTKRGIFKWTGERWQHVFQPGAGKAEVLWVVEHDDHLTASVKKQDPDDRPALAESFDGGETWQLTAMEDYNDIVLAEGHGFIVTRWKGARPRDSRVGYKKHPLSAATIRHDRSAVIDGTTLEIWYDSGVRVTAHHPLLGDAECVHLLDGVVLFAGPQGAYLFDIASGHVVDTLPQEDFGEPLGKTKRLYFLDDGVLLATTTFGTFRSTDRGLSWAETKAEWSVLDAEAIDRDRQGVWWLGCQRGVFFSRDNGMTWSYLKLKTTPHHYAELRRLVVAGDRLCLATKAGLFVSRPGDFRNLDHVETFGRQSIEALLYDPRARALLIGTAAGELSTYHPDTASTFRLAELPIHESTLIGNCEHCLVATGEELYEVTGGEVRAITPAGAEGDLHVATTGNTVILWDRHTAWRRPVGGGHWSAIANWPKGIRHASVAPDGSYAMATDRQYIYHVTL